MTWMQRLLLLALLAAVTGCSSASPPPPGRQSQPPRVRCLADPTETGTRPMFFLFCVESP